MNKDNYYPRPLQPMEVNLDTLATFYKRLLELRAKGDFAEIEKLIVGLDDPGFRDVWMNTVGNRRQFFTLTATGTFRCWARACGYYPGMDHFDAGGTDALLFEVKGGDYHIMEGWAKTHFVTKMFAWHCDADGHHVGNTLWMGENHRS